jgi:AAA domain/Primase C terminal 1 (PriCT-1)
MTMSRSSLLEAALGYFEAQQPVIAVGADKTPYRKGWNEYFSRRQTEDEVREQFFNGAWGVARILYPGSDYIHLDFDGEHSEQAWFKNGIVLPETARVKTPSGGFHLIFRSSNFLKSQAALKRKVRFVKADCPCKKSCGVDFLTHGYAIVPPSPGYREDENWPLECAVKIPDSVVRLAMTAEKKQDRNPEITGPIPDGKRHKVLLAIGGVYLNQKGITHDEFVKKLWAINKSRGKPPLDRQEFEYLAKDMWRRYGPQNKKRNNDLKRRLHLITMAEMLSRKLKPTEFLWEDFLPAGRLTALAAYMKTGKSTFVYPLAVSVSRGEEFLTRQTKKGKVLVLALEEHEDDVDRRYRKLGVTVNDQIVTHYVKDGALSLDDEMIQELKETIAEHEIVLVVIDPLTELWGVQNENDNVEVGNAMRPLRALSHESGAAILALHQENKGGGDFGRSIRGGSAIFAAVDQAILLERLPGEQSLNRRVLKTFGRYNSPPKLVIEWDEDGGYSVIGRPEDMKAARHDTVEAALTNEPQTAEEVADKIDLDLKTARRELEWLKEHGRTKRRGNGAKGSPFTYQTFDSFHSL